MGEVDTDQLDRTLWCGNLHDSVTEDLLFELFLQAGPLESVKIASDRDGKKKSFAFITFQHPESVPYTIQLMNGIRLFDRPLKLQTRPGSSHNQNSYESPSASPRHPQGEPRGMNQQFHRSNSMPSFSQQQYQEFDRGPHLPPQMLAQQGMPGMQMLGSHGNMGPGYSSPQPLIRDLVEALQPRGNMERHLAMNQVNHNQRIRSPHYNTPPEPRRSHSSSRRYQRW